MQIKKTNCKGIRKPSMVKRVTSIEEQMTLHEMFELFMNNKRTEGLSLYTIKDYYTHFRYFTEFIGRDLAHEEITVEIFRDYLGYLLHYHGISPVTVNVRIRTVRAFLRYAFQEGWIKKPIHERFKPVKTPEDEIEGFIVAEVKALFNQVDDSRYVGFRDKVMMYVMLDTMVRVSELLKMRRSNIDLKAGEIKLEPHETKMKRARTVPISTKTIKLLDEYLQETADFEEDLLFLTYDGRRISDNTWRKRPT
jgi:integrase/recombinase XerD